MSGALRVGPRSAGADPGPAAYGRGGTEATVTDADIVLGYINPGYFLGGRLPLREELAHDAALVCDRVVVLVEGRVAHELRSPFTAESLVSASYGA